jgi:glutamate racemase
LLSGLLQLELGPHVVLVSSADETAKDVYATLLREGGLRDHPTAPEHSFLTTGDAGDFRRLAERFLGHELDHVETMRLEPAGDPS